MSHAYPLRLEGNLDRTTSRWLWLVLVKWLLAVPHLIIVGLLVGGSTAASTQQNEWAYRSSGGLITLLALVAAVMLAFSGSYPRGLFDLLMGFNRWVCRVWAYVMLMTDEYPPFRLDSGGDDPTTAPDSPVAPGDRR